MNTSTEISKDVLARDIVMQLMARLAIEQAKLVASASDRTGGLVFLESYTFELGNNETVKVTWTGRQTQ